MRRFVRLLLVLVLLSFCTSVNAQPDIIPHFIAAYDTIDLGYLYAPDLTNREWLEEESCWQIIVSTEDDQLNPVSVDSATLGQPTGDDKVIYQSVVGYTGSNGCSLIGAVILDTDYIGRPVFIRVFKQLHPTFNGVFTESYKPGYLENPEESHFSFVPILSRGHGGFMDMWLDSTGIAPRVYVDSLDLSQTEYSRIFGDTGTITLSASNPLSIRTVLVRVFDGAPSDWNMSEPPLERTVAVSMEKIEYETGNGEFALNLKFTEEELAARYGGEYEPEDMILYEFNPRTSHGITYNWHELTSSVSQGEGSTWIVTRTRSSLPIGGRFTIAPRNLVGVEEEPVATITSYQLHSAYPNPFNPTTRLTLDLPQRQTAVLEVYNMLGRRVATVYQGDLPMGRHEFTFDATRLASGVYFAVAQAGSYHAVKKLVVLK